MKIRKVIVSTTVLLALLMSIMLKAGDNLTASSFHQNKNTDELINTNELIIGFTSESEQKGLTSPNAKSFLKGRVLAVDGITLELNRVIDIKQIIEKEQLRLQKQNANHTILSDEALFMSTFDRMSSQKKALISIYKTSLPNGVDQSKIIKSIKNNSDVEFVEPNYIYKSNFTPADPRYPEQWAHKLTNAEAGWDITKGDASVVVAVIDSGVDYRHEDLAANIWHDAQGNPGIDFVDIDISIYEGSGYSPVDGEDYAITDKDPMDVSGHGTHCAGIIASISNEKGVIGTAPEVKVMPVRAGFAMYDNNKEREVGFLTNDAILNGIFFAVENGASIISMSFGGPSSTATENMLTYALSNDVVLVASAGNNNSDSPSYPAGYEATIAVSSVGSTGKRAFYSNFGYWIDVAAPGGDTQIGTGILSTVPSRINESGYEFLQGTSMSGPYIAGVAALVRSNNNALNTSQVRFILSNGINEVSGTKYIGTGLVDLEKTLQLKEPPIFNAEITNPRNDSVKRIEKNATTLTFSGTASGDSYKLYYGSGYYPQSWNLIASGDTVDNSHLGSIETKFFEEADYMLRLVVTKGDFTKTAYSYFSVQKGVQQGWNADFFNSLNAQGQAPLVVDIDNDGDNEVLAYDQVGRVYLFNHDGSIYTPNFPVSLDTNASIERFHRTYASVGNVVGDALNEIIVLVGDYSQNELFILNPQGQILTRKVFPAASSFPILADNDNDGLDEIHFLTTVNSDFTVNIANENLETEASWTLENQSFGAYIYEPMPVDLDADSIYEIMTVSYSRAGDRASYLNAWTNNGVQLWSVAFPSHIKPVFGDIDNDGNIDIVVIEDTDTGSRLHVLDKTGKAINNNFPIDYPLDYKGAIILADMNKDNSPEIILTEIAEKNGTTYIINKDGELLNSIDFHVPDQMLIYTNEILVSDIDGDNEVELIYNIVGYFSPYPLFLLAYNQDGTEVDGFPRQVHSTGSPVIASTADIDKDGDIEILTGGNSGFTILDLDGAYNPERDEWVTYGRDAKRSRTYIKKTE